MRVVLITVVYDSTASASHLRHGLNAQERTCDMQLSGYAGSNQVATWSMRTLWEHALLRSTLNEFSISQADCSLYYLTIRSVARKGNGSKANESDRKGINKLSKCRLKKYLFEKKTKEKPANFATR